MIDLKINKSETGTLESRMFEWLELYKLDDLQSKSYDRVESTYLNHIAGTDLGRMQERAITYKKKIEEHKRGDFLSAIKTFLENLRIEGCSQAQVSKLAENMSDMFGARYAQSKKIVENDTLTTTVSKAQFNKLFMAVFCDMYVK